MISFLQTRQMLCFGGITEFDYIGHVILTLGISIRAMACISKGTLDGNCGIGRNDNSRVVNGYRDLG